MFELDNVLATLEHADYLFANEDEAAAFGKARGMEGASLQDIAKDIARFKKSNSNPRIAIVTNGAKPIIVARSLPGSEEVELREYPVGALPSDKIVDTNGAGDSFVGAFLAQLYQGKSFDEAMSAGIYLSGEVVQRSGCVFPEKMEWSN